jgi:hypothetical protein
MMGYMYVLLCARVFKTRRIYNLIRSVWSSRLLLIKILSYTLCFKSCYFYITVLFVEQGVSVYSVHQDIPVTVINMF